MNSLTFFCASQYYLVSLMQAQPCVMYSNARWNSLIKFTTSGIGMHFRPSTTCNSYQPCRGGSLVFATRKVPKYVHFKLPGSLRRKLRLWAGQSVLYIFLLRQEPQSTCSLHFLDTLILMANLLSIMIGNIEYINLFSLKDNINGLH